MQKIKKVSYQIFGMTMLLFIAQGCAAQTEQTRYGYLDSLKIQLQEKWPDNKTVNLVFHGHSVPSGYFVTPKVHSLSSYPYIVLQKVKENYPAAVVNTIVTAIGGEQSEQGAERFKEEVLTHRPDVLFIDYALNDRSIGLERAKMAWKRMIEDALAYGTKVVLLTPTPDLKEDILSSNLPLKMHSQQIRQLAQIYKVGLVDSYALFKEIAKTEELQLFMAQKNHINENGHEVVASAIMGFLKNEN